MPERYLKGAIQKDGRLTEESVRFLQIGCGIDFNLPTGRRRFSMVENPLLGIATEKNGGLAEGVARGWFQWAIAGLDTVYNLPDELFKKVSVVRHLGFQPCQFRLGVSDSDSEAKTLEDLETGTLIATKHDYLLTRVIRERNLNLKAVHYQTPELAPKFGEFKVVADIVRTGDTFRENNISPRENLFNSEAVLIKARRLPWGMARIFNNEFLPRVDQALEHPERWFNPVDTIKVSENGQNSDGIIVLEQRPWYKKLLPSGKGSVVALSTLPMALLMTFFTLPNLSAILNPWHSRTSKEKDLRS